MNFTFSSAGSVLSNFESLAFWDTFSALWLRTLEDLDRDVLFLSDLHISSRRKHYQFHQISNRRHMYRCGKRTRLSWEYLQVKPAFGNRIRNCHLNWQQARIMRWLDDAVPKVLSWLVNSVFSRITLYWISFCLQPSAVIQFPECMQLFIEIR